MASSPDKPKASQSEKQLTQQSIAEINEANRIQAAVQAGFLERSQKDRTNQLMNRVNADNAQLLSQSRASMRGNTAALVDGIGSSQRILSSANTNARRNALAEMDNNVLNAVRAGKGMQQTAMSGVNALAQIESDAMRQQMARDAQKRADNVNAAMAIGLTGFDAYKNNEGIFAKNPGKTPTSAKGTGVNTNGGVGINTNGGVGISF
jgi:hypothetical protein